nr:MAG TPA_asm: immunity protein [Caudoviricetes sp.]
MNIKKLKEILKKEKIWEGSYDILQDDYLTGYDGFIINKAANGDFRLYYMERGQRDLLLQTDSEEQVCIEFLRVMGRDDKNLLKYIP